MAKDKSRRPKFWRVKWILLYIVLLLMLVAVPIVTSILTDSIVARIFAICYAIVFIIIAIAIPILSFFEKKKKPNQYGLSKEEYDKYLKQAKNCDIHAK